MKSIVKQLGLFLVTAIYCAAIITVTAINTASVSNGTPAVTIHKLSVSPTVTTNLFAYVAAPENAAETFTNFPVPDTNDTPKWSGAAKKTAEQLAGSLFHQYTNSATNFFNLYKKASIIFPFHYFW